MREEIISRNEDAIILEPDGIISNKKRNIRILEIKNERGEINFKDALAAAVQMINGAADIIGKLQKGAEYIVQVPTQYQAALDAGTLEMMHGAESGKTWATIVKKLANGKQEIVCNCPIKEQMCFQGNPVQSLANTHQNLFMQQKLAELSAQVQEVYDVVLRIEQGQMDDRIGKLTSGRDALLLALKNPEDSSRIREIELARAQISEAQHQIGQVFKSRIEQFRPISEKKWIRHFREITSPKTNYLKKQDEEFEKLQEYYEFYLRATQLLAWSYLAIGDTNRANMVFEQSMEFLKTIDFSHVETLDYIYPEGSMSDAFYNNSIFYVQEEKKVCLEDVRPYDYVQVHVTSDDLKEVLGDGSII